ncbi:MAG: twin-arginine translocation signal domain-containing protein, partial [Nitrososphaerota archaeon]
MCSLLSRRDFLKISGVVSATFAISTQIPFSETLLREVSAEEAQKLKAEAEKPKTVLAQTHLCGFGAGGEPVVIDVRNGRIIRV